MIKKTIIAMMIILLSFASFYALSTDYEYTIFTTSENNVVNPNLLTHQQMIGQIASDFFTTKEDHDDLRGWINVPNVCYHPVMFTGDQYYLRRDINGNYLLSGTLFMSSGSEGSFADTAIIYGHHMRNGTMFGSLKQYEYEEFFQANPCVEVFDGENLYYFKPYTVLYIVDGKEFIEHDWPSDEARTEYFKSLYERSDINMEEGLYPDFTKPMLFLQTCEYYFNNCRLVVGCYLVKTVPYEGV